MLPLTVPPKIQRVFLIFTVINIVLLYLKKLEHSQTGDNYYCNRWPRLQYVENLNWWMDLWKWECLVMIQYVNALNNYCNTKAFLILKFDHIYFKLANWLYSINQLLPSSPALTETQLNMTFFFFFLHFTNFNAQNRS